MLLIIISNSIPKKNIPMDILDFNQSRTAGRWTKEQHQKFLYGLKLYGKNWKKIQDLIQTRTSTQIRSHAQKFFIKIKKQQRGEDESQNHQHSSNSKFAQQTHVNPNEEKLLEKERSIFSFYFEKIAKNLMSCENERKEFNFWDSLIDCPKIQKHRSCELLQIPRQFELDLKKANSWNQSDTRVQMSSCQLIRTQFSCFEQYHPQC